MFKPLTVAQQVAHRDFSQRTLKALARQGMVVESRYMKDLYGLDFGYVVSRNGGTTCYGSHAEVLALAGGR